MKQLFFIREKQFTGILFWDYEIFQLAKGAFVQGKSVKGQKLNGRN
jgi:hypothetical protein